jgi:hypothetical protein
MQRPLKIASLSMLCGASCLLLVAGEARADFCASSDDRPAVCKVEFQAAIADQRTRSIDPGDALDMTYGQSLELQLDARDQNDRSFPHARLAYDFDGEDCRGLVDIERIGTGRFKLRAGRRQGECDLWVWIPGNLNLEWRLHVQTLAAAVAAPSTQSPSLAPLPPRRGYSLREAEYVAQRLYLALLGREADTEGLRGTALEIQRGNLEKRTLDMMQSPEYRSKNYQVTPRAMLERIYESALGRKPDPEGVQAFVPLLQRGQTASVVRELMTSDEFERKLRAELATQ